MEIRIIIFIFAGVFKFSTGLQCTLPNDNQRLDCFPESNADQTECMTRGCCWAPPQYYKQDQDPSSIPYCYYPADYPTYQIKSVHSTAKGVQALLTKQNPSFLHNEILSLNFEAIYETDSRIRIKITDPNSNRFQVPIQLQPADVNPPTNKNYQLILPSNGSFSFEVKRNSDGSSLFKLFGPLLFSDQFIQISTFMSTDKVYGIGEQNRPLLHELSNQWSRIGLWARDNPIDTYINLYGTHPFYMAISDIGKCHGVYFFNSNAQEFVLQPAPVITYRTTGGILDIFIFTGDTPEQTVKQYHQLIGKPMLPPFWSLGFHLSKYGYKNVAEISDTLNRNIKAGIPIDVQWSDIDYMDKYKDFTTDPVNYSNMSNFITQIRQLYGIRYVVIIDPGISSENPGKYSPYDDGLQMNVFIKDSTTNQPLIGKVWPGETVYPDFTHPNITKYWTKQIQQFHHSVPIDGLWIDMNEPSNFYDGSKSGCPAGNPYDNPFFIPSIRDNSLITKTICSSAIHYNNTKHYNLHNLYGYTESVATNEALKKSIPNKRVFILSRSTFSGSGKYTFHWTGDNTANWEQLANSIRQVLNFNIFGIPMIGADICGFIGDSNEELCIRWMQLGAFYPFMRNHNTLGARDQDPASWSVKAQKIMSEIIIIRYILSSHLYTLLVESHLNGGTVLRPLSFEFPTDPVTHDIEHQFMVGSSLLINPVVKQGATSVLAYFPADIWYDVINYTIKHSNEIGKWINLDVPLDRINVYVRGGHILALLQPDLSIERTRNNGFFLYCPLSRNYTASGSIYWDDGESLDSYTSKNYSYIVFNANSTGIVSTPVHIGYSSIPRLEGLVIRGLNRTAVNSVTVNNKKVDFLFDNVHGNLIVAANETLSVGIMVMWN